MIDRLETGGSTAVHDGLTHLVLRWHLERRLEAEIDRARRARASVSLIMIEVDRFERIHRQHGRLASDHALRAVATRIAGLTGKRDVLARYGNVEFAILAAGADLGDATRLAARVQRAIEGLRLFVARGRVPLTVSVGVASHDEVMQYDPAGAALVALAATRLAHAKPPAT
jgi:diguanylate cyclase (GGDEF)-like protein